ncbi:hypothetical protein OPV22_031833 [Ensete ventricosum]|uniref:Uncharacterized protein n=1 Tax=Ensete ventricosum TaxID=4639 RepID=A0AAV8PUW0_ENSVE|nr:hypothetical protein OPV22_031833 [Ensete ventricosum]
MIRTARNVIKQKEDHTKTATINYISNAIEASTASDRASWWASSRNCCEKEKVSSDLAIAVDMQDIISTVRFLIITREPSGKRNPPLEPFWPFSGETLDSCLSTLGGLAILRPRCFDSPLVDTFPSSCAIEAISGMVGESVAF